MDSFVVRTRSRNELIDITQEVKRIVSGSGVRNGLVTVFVPHTTAAVTINENADPSVVHDLLTGLSDLAPANLPKYRHAEGNSDAISKRVCWGFGDPDHQRRQSGPGNVAGNLFCEFDGPALEACMCR